MKVEMTISISGTRDGGDWPLRGEVLECSDVEGQDLIAAGYAVECASADTDGVETADAAPRRKRRGA